MSNSSRALAAILVLLAILGSGTWLLTRTAFGVGTWLKERQEVAEFERIKADGALKQRASWLDACADEFYDSAIGSDLFNAELLSHASNPFAICRCLVGEEALSLKPEFWYPQAAYGCNQVAEVLRADTAAHSLPLRVAWAAAAANVAPKIWFKIRPEVLGPVDVRLHISTNATEAFGISVGFALSGRSGNEPVVGRSKFTRISGGETTLDFTVDNAGHSDQVRMPPGQYNADVEVYWWAFKENPPAPAWHALGQRPKTSVQFTLPGNVSKEVHAAEEVAEKRKWILRNWISDNYDMGKSWDMAKLKAKLGEPERMPYKNHALRGWYFKSADATLWENYLLKKNYVWHHGRHEKLN